MSKCKSALIAALAALSMADAAAQVNRYGLPDIKNYKTDDYQGEEQNWSVARDNRGLYYFGKNSEGVLEFDGVNWRRLAIPNNGSVRSLAAGNDGMIYAGTPGDFGRFSPDASGRLVFESLVPLIPDSALAGKTFNDIFKIHTLGNEIYFCTRQFIFVYDGHKVRVIDMGKVQATANFMTFLVNGEFYVGSYSAGLRRVVGDTVELVPNSGVLAGKNVFAMLPYDSRTALVATAESSFYLFSQDDNTFTPWEIRGIPESMIEGYLYDGIRLPGGNFAFAYVLGGKCSLLEVGRDGRALNVLNTDAGINDESVTALALDPASENDKPMLWMALNNGIANADITSPLRRFDDRNGINGLIVSLCEHRGRLYVGTMSGLLVSDVDENGILHFKPVSNIRSLTIWSLMVFKDPVTGRSVLLAGSGSMEGIFEVHGDRAYQINPAVARRHSPSLIIKSMCQSTTHPRRVYLGLEGGVTWMEYTGHGWRMTGQALSVEGETLRGDMQAIVEDSLGRLWVGSYLKEVLRIDSIDTHPVVRHYSARKGMPDYCGHMVSVVDGQMCFATDRGLFTYDEATDSIVRFDKFGTLLDSANIHRFVRTPRGYVVAESGVERKRVAALTPSSGGWRLRDKPFMTMPAATTDAIFCVDSVLYFGSSGTLFAYNMNDTLDYRRMGARKASFDVCFRHIEAGDSLLLGGAFYEQTPDGIRLTLSQPAGTEPEIRYRDNNVLFEYSALWHLQPEKTRYSYMLDGYRDTWSAWSTETKRDFTNLPVGKYTFRVKARNVYGNESAVQEYAFAILPPWYQTVLAYIVYALLAVGLVVAVVKIYTRRLIAEKERLEKIVSERTAEVVAQKEEIEEQAEHIKSSIMYASKIQNAVLTPPETLLEIFRDYFILYLPRDIVSGDFYWMSEINKKKYCVVADCTGHGVPGGFMSMMGISFLNQIIGQNHMLHANEVLNQLRANIIHALHQTGRVGENKDGMDLALYIIDSETGMAQFAGANNSLVLIRDNEAMVVKADKMPIGIYVKGDKPFTNNELQLYDQDVLYTFSDGYVDQFGGSDKRKFMSKRFRELLLQIHKKPMEEQREILDQTLKDWHGPLDRVDDVVVMGYRHHSDLVYVRPEKPEPPEGEESAGRKPRDDEE